VIYSVAVVCSYKLKTGEVYVEEHILMVAIPSENKRQQDDIWDEMREVLNRNAEYDYSSSLLSLKEKKWDQREIRQIIQLDFDTNSTSTKISVASIVKFAITFRNALESDNYLRSNMVGNTDNLLSIKTKLCLQ